VPPIPSHTSENNRLPPRMAHPSNGTSSFFLMYDETSLSVPKNTARHRTWAKPDTNREAVRLTSEGDEGRTALQRADCSMGEA
jgi:hypothetical protein